MASPIKEAESMDYTPEQRPAQTNTSEQWQSPSVNQLLKEMNQDLQERYDMLEL